MGVSHQPIIELFESRGTGWRLCPGPGPDPDSVLAVPPLHISELVSLADNVPSESKQTPRLGARSGGESLRKPVNVVNNSLGSGGDSVDGAGPAKREQGGADRAASFKTSVDCLDWLQFQLQLRLWPWFWLWVSTSVRCYGKLLTLFCTHPHTHMSWHTHERRMDGIGIGIGLGLVGLGWGCVICHHTNRQVRQPKTLICSAIARK